MIGLAVVAALVYGGATVKLGSRTLFGHLVHIWDSEEAQELVDGVKETSGPMVERVKRGVKAGVEEARRDARDPADGEPSVDRDRRRPGNDGNDRRDGDGGGEGDGDGNRGTDARPDLIITHPSPGQ